MKKALLHSLFVAITVFIGTNFTYSQCSPPASPTSNNITVDCGDPATLTASGSTGNYVWFGDSNGTNILGSGNSLSLGNIFANTTVYVGANSGGGVITDSLVFTNSGATGANGPSQTQVNNSYNGTSLDGLVTVAGGIQQWTVPSTGTYIIDVYGAEGGTSNGGLGAYQSGEFTLNAGDVLNILVGQVGTTTGGGGGSFVVDQGNNPLIIAGGGGAGVTGAWNQSGGATGNNGNSGCLNNAPINNGGTGGGAGGADNCSGSGGGGGFSGSATGGDGGQSFLAGGAGGNNGGFGGGGGNRGGGGGFSGGGSGGCGGGARVGGGGGSFNNGTNIVSIGSINSGNGLVVIKGTPCLSNLIAVTAFVNGPQDPTTNNITIDCGDPATLTASGSTGNYEWFSDANGNNSIGTGNSITTGNLFLDSTFYVAATDGSSITTSTDVYNIDLGNLLGVPTGGNQTRYDCVNSGQGFQWTDATPTGATITSVTVEFKIGVECAPGSKTSDLNGAAQPNFNSAGNHCSTVSPGPGSFITLNVNPADYIVGVNNAFTTGNHGSCFGFERTAALANNFARVTVEYELGTQGCLSNLIPVTVTLNNIQDPTANNVTVDCGDPATLTVSGSTGNYEWFGDTNGTISIGSGNSISLGNLFADSTVYVAATNGTATAGSQTFNHTGAVQNWTVPSGVTEITIEAWGAEGGGSALSGNGSSGPGGNGGYSTGTLSVTPGETLSFYVGGHGLSSTNGPATGGFNGGGSGYASSAGEPGNGGGGASDIRQGGTALANRVIVAGGGGGGGEDSGDQFGHGGGTNGVGYNATYDASQTAPGLNGALGQGATTNLGDGGGGGGGYYGGGTNVGGGVGADTQGGGGGSGYIGGVTAAQTIAGNASMPNPSGGNMTGNSGHGLINISWTATGCLSNLVAVTADVNGPQDPTTNNITIDCGDPATLTASGSTGNYEWFSDANGNNSIGTGSSITTGSLTVDSTFYVAASTAGPVTTSTDVYNIALGNLLGMTSGPSNTRYACSDNNQGFQWTDATPTGATITSVTIEFKIGVECAPGNKTSDLNGAAQPNFNSAVNHCSTTSPGPGSFITLTINPVDYIIGANNIFSTAGHTSCFGFELAAALANNFARVTVEYQQGTPGCLSDLVATTVTINNIQDPTTNNITVDCGDPATLNASGSTGNYEWFGDANGTISIGSGNSISLGNLFADSTVYVAATNGASSSGGAQTFNHTGAVQNWTVPAGVTEITIEAWGAEGGGSALSGNGSSGPGGNGGYSTGTLSVTPGETLSLYIGGHGLSSTNGPAAGGFNGGGSGYASSAGEPGNGGGGASDIRQGGTALANRVIVAGGGGGGGEDSGDQFGHGGGTNGVGYNATYDASQTAPGLNGALGQGATTNLGDGGGGGGGYYGGGTNVGGGVGADTQGGGGGSGYIGGVTAAQTIAGNASMPNPSGGNMTGNSGHGLINISWTGSASSCLSNLIPVTVDVTGPQDPTANNITVDCGDPATLNASGSTGNYEWFSDANGNNAMGTGNTVSLGNLTADSTVYVAASSTGPVTTSTDVYNIALGDLLGTPSGNTLSRYNCGAGGQGFQWTDATPTGATITSVTVEFKIGVECAAGSKTSELNGAPQPNFNSAANHCSLASPGPGSFITLNINPADYTIGANNIFSTAGHTSCFGFELAAALANNFARVTVEYQQGTPGCLSNLVAVTAFVTPLTAPSVSASPNAICTSGTATVTATGAPGGATYNWYSDPNGLTQISSGASYTTPNITASTTYYVDYSNACSSAIAPVTVTVDQPSTPPTLSGGGTFCFGEQVTLTAAGGSVPAGQMNWYENSVVNPSIGTGNSVTISPNGTTDYIVEVPANGACAAASSNTITVTLPTPDNTLSDNNSVSTCNVNQNGYVHFLDANGKLIASINSNGQNLGNVTATSYVEAAPLQVADCATSSVFTSVLDRHWVITPQFQPSSPVEVVLPMEQAEEVSLVTNANTNANPNDDLTGLSDIVLTKYAGPTNIDNQFLNNCTSQGGDQTLDLFNQNISGFVLDYWPAYTGNDLYASYDINSFSEFWLHGTSNISPLPVTLTSFNASCQDQGLIEVSWVTESELNASHFSVERSRDGITWSTVGQITAAGNSSTLKTYSFEDNTAGANFNGYYRLRQVDFDGNETSYGPISIQCADLSGASMEVYPNPSSGNFTLRIYNDLEIENATVQIVDVNGKSILQKTETINNGVTTLLFNQNQLVKGMYYISVIADGFDVAPKKLVIN